MRYRHEIDGLRALAVIPVIFFHAGIPFFDGGYVGVDVFFVISGYLIASIISRDLDRGDFSFLNFYERRVRRILPALISVCLVSIPLAWCLLLPADLKAFSQSLVSIVLLSPNILFSLQADYFDSDAEMKPLLNTWSLGVEEQFYLLFPLLFSALWLLPRLNKMFVVQFLCFISFISMITVSFHYPNFAFYSLPTRAWELMLGVIAALILKGRGKRLTIDAFSGVLACLGLFMIVLSFFVLDKNDAYPGYWTLLPTVGAFLVILYGSHDCLVNRLLTLRWVGFIGLISYSLYLWHHPIFAFVRHSSLGQMDHAIMFFAVGLSFLVAYFSWRLIEKPFRSSYRVPRRSLFISLSAGITLILVFGLLGHFSNGYQKRTVNGIALDEISQDLSINYGLSQNCDGLEVASPCVHGDSPSAVLWGDSYAMHMAQALQNSATELSFVQFTVSSCSPIVGLSIIGGDYSQDWAQNCLAFNQRIFDWISNSDDIEFVVLSSMFNLSEYDLFDGRFRSGYDSGRVSQQFIDTLSALQSLGKKIVIVSPTPSAGHDLGRCLARAKIVGKSLDLCDFDINSQSVSYKKASELLSGISKHGFPVYWLEGIICRKERCSPSIDGVFIYRDKGHLSRQGSAFLGKKYDISGSLLNL